jgi:hypothetical protein
LIGKPEGKRPLGRKAIGVVWGIILKTMLKKQDVKLWTGFIWLKIGSSGGSCGHSNELSGSIKGRKFLFHGMSLEEYIFHLLVSCRAFVYVIHQYHLLLAGCM